MCDVLSPQNKASLHELCRVMGLRGKPDGVGGADVERYYREGRIAEVAAYCETDVVNTYRVWLRHELFRGRLSEYGLQVSEANLSDYRGSHSNTKPHLVFLSCSFQSSPPHTVPVSQRVETERFHAAICKIDIVSRIRDKNLCLMVGAHVRHMAGVSRRGPRLGQVDRMGPSGCLVRRFQPLPRPARIVTAAKADNAFRRLCLWPLDFFSI
jgi:hypothetical protein